MAFYLSFFHANISSLSCSRTASLFILAFELQSLVDLDKCNFHIYCLLEGFLIFERKERVHLMQLSVTLQNGTTEEVTSEEEEEEDMGEVCMHMRLLS